MTYDRVSLLSLAHYWIGVCSLDAELARKFEKLGL